MVFCNSAYDAILCDSDISHNPYFNRWFSAIVDNRPKKSKSKSHNPYFNRWFSAIDSGQKSKESYINVTILILIDGFLQCKKQYIYIVPNISHNPYFNRWFSAIILYGTHKGRTEKVTILILIDGFLQYTVEQNTVYPSKKSQSLF